MPHSASGARERYRFELPGRRRRSGSARADDDRTPARAAPPPAEQTERTPDRYDPDYDRRQEEIRDRSSLAESVARHFNPQSQSERLQETVVHCYPENVANDGIDRSVLLRRLTPPAGGETKLSGARRIEQALRQAVTESTAAPASDLDSPGDMTPYLRSNLEWIVGDRELLEQVPAAAERKSHIPEFSSYRAPRKTKTVICPYRVHTDEPYAGPSSNPLTIPSPNRQTDAGPSSGAIMADQVMTERRPGVASADRAADSYSVFGAAGSGLDAGGVHNAGALNLYGFNAAASGNGFEASDADGFGATGIAGINGRGSDADRNLNNELGLPPAEASAAERLQHNYNPASEIDRLRVELAEHVADGSSQGVDVAGVIDRLTGDGIDLYTQAGGARDIANALEDAARNIPPEEDSPLARLLRSERDQAVRNAELLATVPAASERPSPKPRSADADTSGETERFLQDAIAGDPDSFSDLTGDYGGGAAGSDYDYVDDYERRRRRADPAGELAAGMGDLAGATMLTGLGLSIADGALSHDHNRNYDEDGGDGGGG